MSDIPPSIAETMEYRLGRGVAMKLRWSEGRLQYAEDYTTYRNGKPIGSGTTWIDVPQERPTLGAEDAQ